MCVYVWGEWGVTRAWVLQLLEDLAADRRLTFRRIAASRRPSPVIRRLADALFAVCRRLERAAGILPPPRKRRRLRAQGTAAPRRRIVGAAGGDSGVLSALAGPPSGQESASSSLGALPAGLPSSRLAAGPE